MTGIVAHTYPEWWLKLTGQAAHLSTDYSDLEKLDFMGLSEKSESPFSVWKYVKRIVKIEIVVQKGARENLEYKF